MIYDVAQSGALGTVAQVEQSRLYDFMSYLSFMKSQSKHQEIATARVTAESKSGRRR